MEARYMNTIVSEEMSSDLKWPMDWFRVEKPPVAHTLNAWLIASNGDIPASI